MQQIAKRWNSLMVILLMNDTSKIPLEARARSRGPLVTRMGWWTARSHGVPVSGHVVTGRHVHCYPRHNPTTPPMHAATPPTSIHIALSVGAPVNNRDTSELNDCHAMPPRMSSRIPRQVVRVRLLCSCGAFQAVSVPPPRIPWAGQRGPVPVRRSSPAPLPAPLCPAPVPRPSQRSPALSPPPAPRSSFTSPTA